MENHVKRRVLGHVKPRKCLQRRAKHEALADLAPLRPVERWRRVAKRLDMVESELDLLGPRLSELFSRRFQAMSCKKSGCKKARLGKRHAIDVDSLPSDHETGA